MMPWDSGTWDSGHWDSDDSDPNSNPKPKKNKPMKHQDYFPMRIGDQIIWLSNFRAKLLLHATTLGLDPDVVAAIVLDVDNTIYALERYRAGVATFTDAAYMRVKDALFNEALPGTIAWLTFAAPATPPTAVAYGCLDRVFGFISGTLREKCDDAMAQEFGIVGPQQAAPDSATTAPEFTLRMTDGGKLEVVWTKGQFDGVKLEFDRGTAGPFADMDLRPNYTLNWLPPAGTAVMIKVRLRYIYKGEDFGQWSEWKGWTLAVA
ncbi:MAG: hypothetical protein ABMA13_10250 [Chthoniobacteraceae bacterium]